MNDVNRTEPNRPLLNRPVRTATEGVRQTEGQAANVRPAAGNDVPETVREVQVGNQPVEAARAIRAQVEDAVASLNEYARKSQRSLEFSVDSDLGRPVVQVIDATTQEVIRQIPNETALSVARNLQANLEQIELQRAAQHAGVDAFVSADVSLGLVNTHV